MTSVALVVYTEEVNARKHIHAAMETALSNLRDVQVKAAKKPPPPPVKKKPTPVVVPEPVALVRPKNLVPPGAVFIGVIAFLIGIVLCLHLF